MAGFGFSELLNPLVGGDFLSALIPLFMERRDAANQFNDPNTLAFINNIIGDYNSANAYNPSTGQHHAGSPFGDSASGHGGAYGTDSNGNPLSPFQGSNRTRLTQMQGLQDFVNQGVSNLQGVSSGAPPQSFNLGALGLDPGAIQGVDQSVRNAPQPLAPLKPRSNFLDQFLGSYAIGTTSIPRDGLAYVHQGEAIVPATQNPRALPPGVPGAPMKGAPVVNNVGGPMPAPPAPPMQSPQPQLGAPQAQPNNVVAFPGGGAAGNTGGTPVPQFQPLTPSLSPQVQQQLINRGTESIDQQNAGTQRALAQQAALSGGGGGPLSRQQFDAELARRAQISNLNRDVGLEAANRQFTDTLQGNQFELQKALGMGQLGQNQQALDIQRMLGLGNLGVAQGQLALSGELGRGQLGISQQAQDLARQLGLGQLGQGQQALDLQNRLQNQNYALGQGQLGLGQQAQDLARQLGLGNLDVARQQTAQQGAYQQGQLALGQGQLGISQQAQDLAQLLGLGQLGQGQQALDLQGQLQQQNYALGQGQLGVQQGQLGINQQAQDLAQLLGLGNLGLGQQQLAQQGQYQQGQLANESRGLDIQQLLGQQGLNLQQQLGLGGLANERRGLDLQQAYQQGQLDLGQGQLNRGIANDANSLGQWGYEFLNQLNQQDFQNNLQTDVLNNNQNQFGDLLGLLGQFSGQSGAGATGSSGGNPILSFIQNLFGGGGSNPTPQQWYGPTGQFSA